MELHLHIWTNLEYFQLLNKWFLLSMWKKDREIADFIVANYPWEFAETISPQYEVNFIAIREIKKRFWPDIFNKIDWIYYWSDNCEFLVPFKKELENAINEFKEFNKNFPPHKIRTFTFVTPYVGEEMLKRLDEDLAYLNDLNIKNPIEIVVNDFWVLNLITKKYKNLKINFWRLIHKLLKTPLIDTYWYAVHPTWEDIKNKNIKEIGILKEEIIKNQLKFYNSSEVNLEIYRNFLKKFDVKRVALDFMQNREDLTKIKFDNAEVWIDLYYPWAIVFTWRLCDTSAIKHPSKWFYATDEVCNRVCNFYDIQYNIKTVWYNLTQRWNAGYRSELILDNLDESFIKSENNRFVFSPFIPV